MQSLIFQSVTSVPYAASPLKMKTVQLVDKSNINTCVNLVLNGYAIQETLISFIDSLLCSLIVILSGGVMQLLPIVFMDHLKRVRNLSVGLLQVLV